MRRSGYRATSTVLFLLCLMYMITYVDRVNISTAALVFKGELGLSNTDYGAIFAAFGWSYACFQIVGGWIGGFLTSDFLGVLFLALAVGAALQVVIEVGRYVARRAPGGLRSGHVIGGYLAGIVVMYTTGLLVA